MKKNTENLFSAIKRCRESNVRIEVFGTTSRLVDEKSDKNILYIIPRNWGRFSSCRVITTEPKVITSETKKIIIYIDCSEAIGIINYMK